MIGSQLAPHDEQRQVGGEVEAIERAHALAARADDGAQRVEEGQARLAVAEVGHAAPHLGHVVARAQADAREHAADLGPQPAGGAGDERQHPLRAGQRGRAQQRADAVAQAAARDEDEALAQLGVLIGELHRHAAAQRVPDDRRALDADQLQQVADAAGEGAQRVVAARLGRGAVAQEVGRDDVVGVGQRGPHGLPGQRVRADAVEQDDGRSLARAEIADAVAVEHRGA